MEDNGEDRRETQCPRHGWPIAFEVEQGGRKKGTARTDERRSADDMAYRLWSGTGREKEGRRKWKGVMLLFVGCLTFQQHARVSQGRICEDNFTCCHTETEVADQTFYRTQSLYIDFEPTSPSANPKTPSAWKGSHWSANF